MDVAQSSIKLQTLIYEVEGYYSSDSSSPSLKGITLVAKTYPISWWGQN